MVGGIFTDYEIVVHIVVAVVVNVMYVCLLWKLVSQCFFGYKPVLPDVRSIDTNQFVSSFWHGASLLNWVTWYKQND